MQDFINSYISLFQNYANFNGRWRRRQFWGAFLINCIVAFVISFVGGMLHLTILSSIYSLALLIPSIAAGVRRLHDIGKQGIYYLFVLIPIAGVFILLYWFCQPGVVGDNQFGPDPMIDNDVLL